MEFAHTSVLLNETIEGLSIRPDGIYVDGTLGGGGHASAIAAQLTSGKLIGIDQDGEAIEAAGRRLAPAADRVILVRDNYCNLPAVLSGLGYTGADGILLDLGVSSWQLDSAERGFSYRFDAPLDMRMDRRQALTAGTIVNEYDEMEIYRILRDYGEEKFAKNIAKHIAAERQKKPIETTGELNGIIKDAGDGRASVQTDLSGAADRLQPGAGGAGILPGCVHRSAESGREAVHHHLPFPGGPHRQERVPPE